MLQRAASNAYSWWWASHIRTKQSKWLEQSLADMEEKVHDTLQIIDHDGDSFARRAEMYYRRRPEIINFVEEAFRAYRALAERFDHISRDLQSANRTIAQVFPERVQFALDEDDEHSGQAMAPSRPVSGTADIPKAPKAPGKLIKSATMMRRGGALKKDTSAAKPMAFPSSGLSKPEAMEEIDTLQKGILGLQTEKEFVRSIYQHTTDKYLDIENRIAEMQERVYSLQDEFGIGMVIETSEARSLMVATAINSCQETLKRVHGKQEQSARDAKAQYARIKEAHHELEAIKDEFLSRYQDKKEEAGEKAESPSPHSGKKVTNPPTEEEQDLEGSREMIKENLAKDTNSSMSVIGLAENIDELVSKVLNLETEVISQDALVKRLTSETDELHGNIRKLEGDKESLLQNSETMKRRLNEVERELHRVQSLKQIVTDHNTNLQKYLTEASCNIELLSERLHDVKLDESFGNEGLFEEVKETPNDRAAQEAKMKKMRKLAAKLLSKDKPKGEGEEGEKDDDSGSDDFEDRPETKEEKDLSSEAHNEEGNQPNWNMYMNTLDERERTLLEEYTSVLKNYKDVRRKLSEAEKRNKDSLYGLSTKVRDLVRTNTMREAEIQALLQQLGHQETNPENNQQANPENNQQTNPEDNISTSGNASSLGKEQDPIVDPGSEKDDSTPGAENNQQTNPEDNISTSGNASSLGKEQDPIVDPGSEKDDSTPGAENNQQTNPKDNISTSGNASSLGKEQDPIVDPGSEKDDCTPGVKDTPIVSRSPTDAPADEKENDSKVSPMAECGVSTVEEQIRMDIDELLEENLGFWLRLSTSVIQKQKFQTTILDLKAELAALEDKMKEEGRDKSSRGSEAKPIYRHLREIQTEMKLWGEQNAVLKDEVQARFSSLSHIQDEIPGGCSGNSKAEDAGLEITEYQAAKYQGEILNMTHENIKVESEIEKGFERVKALQLEVDDLLDKLDDDFGVSTPKSIVPQNRNASNHTRIPLSSFLFGAKLKKQKRRPSFFACVSPSLQRQYSDLGSPTYYRGY